VLPPECQVCDNFDVQSSTCCGARVTSTHHGKAISDFVRAEYAGTPPAIDNGLFRLLNEDVRYELRSLYEDTTAWSAYINFQGTKPQGLPPAATRMAQTSAFVHIRLLSYFFTVDDGDPNETRATAFGAQCQEPPVGHIAWRDAINSNVMHLNQLRPRALNVRRRTTRAVPQNVQLEVGTLTDVVSQMWRTFTADPAVADYAKLTTHLDDYARAGAAAVRSHLKGLLGVVDAAMWHPTP
jgi:hypothetical protein